ncbi:type III-B CRISPR module RAMP protein Cmr4 [Phototrophicus methaneseepsis]|uniref:Type III-B CRISPR module RAMP protein Cmr4 n=1 Tax=Phototrophicus methaneseepsis TaxID=2710758 RepID=A0A7S8E610_9CHLR|nr:type III-B CRISPR module RAMP protein Cmr4 [Phototrophicus methaneseepsis]QPC80933.1 type III-B CRISPR module RAMP protein Cmr4 [Phototrophicus methaneseepsis]
MDVQKHILYLYAETPMHVGTGVGLGAVDMPIQREKHTGYPIIQASGIKGALRDTAQLKLGDSDVMKSIFGSDAENREITHASAMSPSDARILLFPVRALNGVFVWITSSTVLARFKQETELNNVPDVPEINQGDLAQVSSENLINAGQIMLEEYTYSSQVTNEATEWANYLATNAFPDADNYWHKRIKSHFAILPDNEFRDFVRYSTEIVTRIHIDDVKKTVKDGQLFTQELLPADSLLYSFIHVTDSRDEKIKAENIVGGLQDAMGNRLQIGGDETVGRGRVRLNWQEVK